MYLRPYNPSSKRSIFEYSAKLIGLSLAKIIPYLEPETDPNDLDEMLGKGGMGQLVEKYFFGYAPNSKKEPDFPQAGVELKVTPLKRNTKQELVIKERLVCNMINYHEIILEKFENSSFYKKCKLMLLIFYLETKGIHHKDKEFFFTVLWKLQGKDLEIIRQDFLVIQKKVLDGKAEELTEGCTNYLGACTKGHKGDNYRTQPNSDIKARQRAYCLKTAYMRELLKFVQSQESPQVTNVPYEELYPNERVAAKGVFPVKKIEELVTYEELQQDTFDNVLAKRYVPYLGKDYREIGELLSLTFNSKEKSVYATVVKNILKKGLTNLNETEEFKKAGIKLKTIRIEEDGSIKEDMSFANIDYKEVLECEYWTESKWYDIITTRYMFVIFRREQIPEWGEDKRYVLDRMFFWSMPVGDYLEAEEYWNNIKGNVVANTLWNRTDPDRHNTFWKISDKRDFHVRPKATNAADTTPSPITGEPVRKRCYWFSKNYLMSEIKASYGDEWDKIFKKTTKKRKKK